MTRRRILAWAIAILAVTGIVATATSVSLAAGAARTGDIVGTIRVDGCVLRSWHLVLRAQDIGVGAPAERDVAPVARDGALAILRPTSDEHVLQFRISNLDLGRTYHLALRTVSELLTGYPPNPCNRVFWRGPFGGLATAGGAAVTIEGVAARTTLEVFRIDDDAWVGATEVDLGEPAVQRFRWRSTLPAVIRGELQLATEPFPVLGRAREACIPPEGGIVYRQSIDTGRGEWHDFDVDLRAALGGGRTLPAGGETAGGSSTGTAVLMGAPVYARVVPVTAEGPACDAMDDGVPGWVLLVQQVKEILDAGTPVEPTLTLSGEQRYRRPFFDPSTPYSHPVGRESGYVVVKDHTLPTAGASFVDPLGAAIVNAKPSWKGKTLHPGDYFWLDPGQSSWYEDLADGFGNLVTGAIDALAWVVDNAAKLYQRVQDAVKAVIVAALNAAFAVVPGLSCGSACQDLVQLGMTTALASAGMPPSLPNWDALKGDAIDYVAAQVSSQTGIPAELTEPAAHALADEAIMQMTAHRGSGGSADWVEPYFGTDPAATLVRVAKTGGDLPANLVLHTAGSVLYRADAVELPRRFSGELVVPIVLQPNVTDVPAPVCTMPLTNAKTPCDSAYVTRWYRNHFRAKVEATACVPLSISSRSRVGSLYLDPGPGLAMSLVASLRPRDFANWVGSPFSNC